MSDSNKINDIPLSDNVWARVVQVVQLAMLTGTDVVDYLRLIRVSSTDQGSLDLSHSSNEQFERVLEELVERLGRMQEQNAEPDNKIII